MAGRRIGPLLSRQSISLSGVSTRTVTVLYGDYDNDSVDDLFAIRHTGSRQFRVLVFSGASHFRSRLLAANTALVGASAGRYAFGLGDYDHAPPRHLRDREPRHGPYRDPCTTRRLRLPGPSSAPSAHRFPRRRPAASSSRSATATMTASTTSTRSGSGMPPPRRSTSSTAQPTLVPEGPIRISKSRRATGIVRFLVGDQNGDGHDDIYGINYRPAPRRRGSMRSPALGSTRTNYTRAWCLIPPARAPGNSHYQPSQASDADSRRVTHPTTSTFIDGRLIVSGVQRTQRLEPAVRLRASGPWPRTR